MKSFEHTTVEANGAKLHVAQEGQGKPLLLRSCSFRVAFCSLPPNKVIARFPGHAVSDFAEPWVAYPTMAWVDPVREKSHAVATTRRCPWRRDRGAGLTVISTSRPSRVRKCISRSVEKPDS
jgi:hypothetical protein